MKFIADFHVHSHFSVATSKDCDPENLHRWAQLKGLTVVGTGDCTHPGWLAELKEKLEPAEPGLYRLKSAPADGPQVKFILSGEISSIYKKAGQTRKIHNLILLPTFAAAEAINRRLEKIGNIHSDGRPILGLDSYRLFQLVLEECPEAMFIPAHIWTPHFSLFGASSGFDRIEECFEDLTSRIAALETGLSSDPPMNWRLSALDRFALVSNSDAHSPRNLAREANLFDTELSFHGIRSALITRDPNRFLGTVEFFPEEGKYHYDGHRICGVRWTPAETIAAKGVCPKCGKKVTVGVLHRVELLADRPEGVRPKAAREYQRLVPLAEIIAAALGMGESSTPVERQYYRIVREAGSELAALRVTPIDVLTKVAGPLVAEGIRRVRAGEVEIAPGYDGEYGTISVFRPGERAQVELGRALFQQEPLEPKAKRPARLHIPSALAEAKCDHLGTSVTSSKGFLDTLNTAQREAVIAEHGPIIVIAGPGTGKTRTLTFRAAYLIQERGVPPEHILAVTFTNKAADEMRQRLREILGQAFARNGMPTIGTFHSICLDALQARSREPLLILDDLDSLYVIQQLLKTQKSKLSAQRVKDEISLLKSHGIGPDAGEVSEALKPIYQAYQRELEAHNALDFDDILLKALQQFENDAITLKAWRHRFPHILVDEFQDVNAVQYRLVKLWAGDGANLFVIGDPDQAIYGFRGADHRFFERLLEDFPSGRRLRLTICYRCTGVILDAALGVIRKISDRTDVRLESSRGRGAKLRIIEVPGEQAEGIAIVHEISRMVGGATMLEAHEEHKGRSFSDIAVLFRTNRQADKLEECFLTEGIPYRIIGQRSFLESQHVRQALAFFRCVVNPRDRLRLAQCLGSGRFDSVDRLSEALDAYRAKTETETPVQSLTRWAQEHGLQQEQDIARLIRLAAGFDDWATFLKRLLLFHESELERSSGTCPEAVSLMTLHAAKGLEFPVVFIAGVEDGLIPIRSRDSDLAEERRLFYVGITRAKDELILLHARSRAQHGQVQVASPSPFLDDLPGELVKPEAVKKKPKAKDKQLRLF